MNKFNRAYCGECDRVSTNGLSVDRCRAYRISPNLAHLLLSLGWYVFKLKSGSKGPGHTLARAVNQYELYQKYCVAEEQLGILDELLGSFGFVDDSTDYLRGDGAITTPEYLPVDNKTAVACKTAGLEVQTSELSGSSIDRWVDCRCDGSVPIYRVSTASFFQVFPRSGLELVRIPIEKLEYQADREALRANKGEVGIFKFKDAISLDVVIGETPDPELRFLRGYDSKTGELLIPTLTIDTRQPYDAVVEQLHRVIVEKFGANQRFTINSIRRIKCPML